MGINFGRAFGFVAANFAPEGNGGAPIRLEAESLSGQSGTGFITKAATNTSGGSAIQLKVGGSGAVTADLAARGVAPGFYLVRVVYLDETDGNSSASISLNGAAVGAWNFNGLAGTQLNPGAPTGDAGQLGNWRTLTFDTIVQVSAGAVLRLAGTQNGGELTRIDFIELIPTNRPNAAPTDLTLSASTVAENAAGAVIGTLAAVDPDAGETFIFGVNDPRFEVVGNTLKLKAGNALNFEAASSVTVAVTATDSLGLSYTENFAIAVTNVNEAPAAIAVTGGSVVENAAGAIVGTLSGSDPDAGDVVTFTTGDARFEIVGATLRLRSGIALDHEAAPQVTVSVTATDSAGLSRTQNVVVAVANVNEAPTAIALSNSAVTENAAGAVIGTLTVTEPDIGDSLSYSLSDSRFQVVGNQLRLKPGVSLDHEAASTVSLTVTTTDAGGLFVSETFTIAVANANEAPTAITLDEHTLPENVPGAIAGNIAVVDPDLGDNITLTVDDPRFVIFNGKLRLAEDVSLNFETTPSLTVNVTATDAAGASITRPFTIVVRDVNEAPVLSGPAAVTIQENTKAVAGYNAADPDAGSPAATFSIVGGADAALFTIDASGALAFRTEADFERRLDANGDNVYQVTIGASDGALTTTRDVAVTVANLVEATPVFRIEAERFTAAGNRNFITESVPAASGAQTVFLATGRTGSLTATAASFGVTPDNYTLRVGYIDETDGATPVTIRVDGVLVASWTFDGVSGVQVTPGGVTGAAKEIGNYRVITFNTPFAITASSVITVGAVQTGAESARIDYIELRGVERANAFPTNITLGNATVAENVAGGVVGALTVADPDANSTFSFSVNDSRFEVVNGQLKLKAGIALDFEATPSTTVAVTATDNGGLSVTRNLTIGVTNVNEAPTAIALAGPQLVSSQTAGAVVGTLTVTDPDAGGSQTLTVSDNRFEVVGGQLKLKAGVALNFATVQSVPLTVTATDQGGLATSQSFTIRVNAAPSDLVFAGPLTTTENVAGASFGAVTVTDGNATDTHVLTVDDARFEVVGGVLKLKDGISLDHEAGATVTVNVTATDPGGLSRTEAVSVAVGDVNEAPSSISLAFANGLGIFENTPRQIIGTLSGTDPDSGATLTFTVEGDSRFAIDADGTTLRLVRNVLNHEQTPVFQLEITATDQFGATYKQNVPITILDVNEAPAITSGPATVTIKEGFTAVATYGGTDPDDDAVLSYSLAGGTDQALFTIDATTGVLAFIAPQDFENKADFNRDGIYNVVVAVSDGTFTATQAVKVYVADVQEAGTSTLYTTKINFQPASSVIPEGYFADTGKAYNDADGYGWVTEASVADGTANGTIPDAIDIYFNPNVGAMNDRGTAGLDPRLTSYAHFEFPLAPASSAQSWAWEHALANGTYIVKVAIGDTAGQLDSNYHLNIEGQQFIEPFVPLATLRTTLVTGVVTVTDGRLTLDSIGGDNTEIQYIEIEQLADVTPGDGRPVEADYSSFLDAVSTVGGEPARLLNQATNINPNASFAVDVNIVFSGDGPDGNTINPNTVRLFESLTGKEVLGTANTSAGFDTIVFTPNTALKENTAYNLVIDGVKTVLGEDFLPFSTSFATGLNPQGSTGEAAFIKTDTDVSFGFYSGLVISPDGSKLYASSILGTITRWDIDPATGSLLNEQVFAPEGLAFRAIIGLTFDPNDPNTLWISNNDPLGTANAEDFTGKISRISIDDNDAAFTGTVQDYIVGLPRSVRDHLTNSLAFHTDPVTGETRLYVNQGSNSAQGDPDNAWGNRPERLLSAAVLEIDHTRDVSAGPINVQTQDPSAVLPPGAGAQVGYYNPFEADAPVKLYATGVRNAYDLVWHSNGHLYVPANGSAAGGNAPDDPNTPVNEAILGVDTQNDYLFDVREGFYYGHPNPTRGEYIVNGGNPTAGTDPNQVGQYPVGVTPPANYGGTAYDFSRNRSPNGAVEFISDVFGDSMQGNLLVVEYSGGNDIVSIKFDAQGRVITDEVTSLVDAAGNVITLADPIDLVTDATGRIYVASLADGKISLLTPTTRDPSPPQDRILEAENAVIVGAKVAANQPSFTGSGFVDFTNNVGSGESITWTFDVAVAGIYRIGFRYALSSSPANVDGRPLTFTLNGKNEGSLDFMPSGSSFRVWATESLEAELNVGTNIIRLTSIGSSGANVDSLLISPAPLQELNTRPFVSGTQANLSFAQGAPVAFVLRDVVVSDLDQGDEATYSARLRGGGELPDWLEFEPGTQTFSSSSAAPPGVYEIEIRADDGQDLSIGAVVFAIEIVRQFNVADVDGDGTLNAADNDDDGDGVPDTRDPFQEDPSNGKATPVTEGRRLVYDFSTRPFGADPGFNGFGITGFHVSGARTPEQLGLGSTALSVVNGALHIENAGAGDLASNDLVYGAQFGIDPVARRINISATFDHPYDTRTSTANADWRGVNFGIKIGTGDNQNYVKLVLEGQNPTGAFIQMETREGNVRIDTESLAYGRAPTANPGPAAYRAADADDRVTFRFEIDTVLGTLTAFWSIRNGANGLPDATTITGQSNTITLGGDLLKAIQGDYQLSGAGGALVDSGLAVGIIASSRGATNQLDVDVLDITVEGLVTDPDVTLVNKQSAVIGARGVFNFIQDPLANNQGLSIPRAYHDVDVITIRNDGTDLLSITELDLDGPFQFLDATDLQPFTLEVGQSRDIEIRFDNNPALYDPEISRIFRGQLTVISDDPDEPVAVADLAGYWAPVPEVEGREASFNQLMEVFGFGTRADQSKFDNFDIYEQAGPDEVLVPYWKLADGYAQATVTQIAALHDISTASFFITEPGNGAKTGDILTPLLVHDEQYNQSFLPIRTNGSSGTVTFNNAYIPDAWAGNDYFGIRIAGQFSDPRLNTDGPGRLPEGVEGQRGHFIRFFVAKDEAGNVIEDTYVVVQDYQGINYDYQDNVYLIQGITPVEELLIG